MRSLLLPAVLLLAAAPALAADPAAPKERKVCKAVNNGNPLFPQMKCRSEPIETSAATPVPTPAADPAPAAPDQPAAPPAPPVQPH